MSFYDIGVKIDNSTDEFYNTPSHNNPHKSVDPEWSCQSGLILAMHKNKSIIELILEEFV